MDRKGSLPLIGSLLLSLVTWLAPWKPEQVGLARKIGGFFFFGSKIRSIKKLVVESTYDGFMAYEQLLKTDDIAGAREVKCKPFPAR